MWKEQGLRIEDVAGSLIRIQVKSMVRYAGEHVRQGKGGRCFMAVRWQNTRSMVVLTKWPKDGKTDKKVSMKERDWYENKDQWPEVT